MNSLLFLKPIYNYTMTSLYAHVRRVWLRHFSHRRNLLNDCDQLFTCSREFHRQFF